MSKFFKTKQLGYTLLEMVVVVGVVGLILPVIFTIVIIITQQQLKVQRVVQVKRQGDQILTFFKNKILKDVYIIQDSTGVSQCVTTGIPYSATNGSNFHFVKAGSENFHFLVNAAGVFQYVDNITAANSSDITTTRMRVSNFQINCVLRSTLTGPVVQISYQIEYNTTSTRPEERAILNYQTRVRLRAF